MSGTNPNLDENPRQGCQNFELNLQAYLEGEDRPEVVCHASQCPYCHIVIEDLKSIGEASRELPLAEPPARLWANIRAALVDEGIVRVRPSFWQRWFPVRKLAPEAQPVGALLALATMALIVIGSTQNFESFRPSDKMRQGGAVVTAGFVAPGITPAFTETVRQMEAAFRAQEDALEPAMKTTYKKSLEALDLSIRETMGQCKRNPDDQLARQYLIDAYHTKAEVLASALEFSR